jgi:5-hydroxyisourate hydrolase-like protein (transthyretin family)
MQNDIWSMFKNYMHNELQITKEDIQQWIKDAVTEESKRLVAQEYGKFDIAKGLERLIFDNRSYFSSDKTLSREIRQDLCEAILKNFKFSISNNEIKDNRL